MTKALTPMMQQFRRMKAENPDTLLLFRCGDFYETYCEDAEVASRVLGLTLTRRNNGSSQGDAMAGFPYHALDTYLPRLVAARLRVAVCDQLEDPKLAKTIVKRGITEVVTPGVALADSVLRQKENNFLAAVAISRQGVGVALLDASTGEFLCGEGGWDYARKLLDDFQPKEVLYERGRERDFAERLPTVECPYALDDWCFERQGSEERLCRHFGVRNLKGFGVAHMAGGVSAAGAVLQYMTLTHHTLLGHVTRLGRIDTTRSVRMDRFTLRSLEILRPMTEEGTALLGVVDKTLTAMGGRRMRRWLTFPLRDVGEIRARQDVVEYFTRHPEFRDIVGEQLARIADMERLVAKITTLRINPREVLQLAESLDAVARLKYTCEHSDLAALLTMGQTLDACNDMRERMVREISPDTPLLVAKGGVIREGVNQELDELRALHRDSTQFLLSIQRREAERTGIASLKVGFNNVFGYYLEVRNTYKNLVPEEWIRKQTLTQAERYVTQELKEYEQKILTAEDRIHALEGALYSALVKSLARIVAEVQQDAAVVSQLDCLLSFALTALGGNYCRPVVDEGRRLEIRQGRHAVIETRLEAGERYVPNDVTLDCNGQQIMIVTGPNMSGKSALLRQTALITLLAQTGSFVPAEAAHIGVVDQIFTRVGASDNIAAGESTFMVEMTEAAAILNNATDRSLVLFDELGRGTSTYDGISIAWAIVERLHNETGARTLFATHYHELNDMARELPRVRNWNVEVEQKDGHIVFTRRLVEGGAEHSFGIHVAEMAGMPRSVVGRAAEVLAKLEGDLGGVLSSTRSLSPSCSPRVLDSTPPKQGATLFDADTLASVRDAILDVDIDNLTPLQALNKLSEIKGLIK